MIVDNADSSEVVFEPWSGRTNTPGATISANNSLSDYLPTSRSGWIEVTSRYREVLDGLDVCGDNILEVGPIEVEVARILLPPRSPLLLRCEWARCRSCH